MRFKLFASFLLTVIISLAVVSAATTFSVSPTTLTFDEPVKTLSFTITPTTYPSTYEITTPTILDENDDPISFNVIPDVVINSGSETVNVTVSLDYDDLIIGDSYTGDIVVKDKNNLTETENIAVNFLPTFCKEGEASSDDYELRITDVNIDNDDGDDEEWVPLDDITIEVEVSNEGNDDVDDIIVVMDLIDSDGKSVVSDLDFSNTDEDEIELGDLRDGKDETVEFTFRVDPDFEEGDYRLLIKAYSDKEDEDQVCTSVTSDLDNDYYQSIEGIREEDEDKHIIVTDIRVSPDIAQCGERVQVTGEVYNVGDEDYEDQVKVTMEVEGLGISEERIIREDFDQGDSSDVDFEFDVPLDAEEGSYTIKMRTYYDYNDRHDVYEIISDDTFTNFDSPFRVQGNCKDSTTTDGGTDDGTGGTTTSSAQITAQLDPETPDAVAGKNIIVRANLQNTGTMQTTYTISVFGNSAWSDLVSIEPQVVTLNAGSSRDISIVLKIDDDVEGDQSFTIRASHDGRTTEKEVELLGIEATQVEGEAVVAHLQKNWFIYLIVIINIILIIAIIAVVRRMLAPRSV